MDDSAQYHETTFDHPEPDPYPEDIAAKRRRLEGYGIRAAVTVYEDTGE